MAYPLRFPEKAPKGTKQGAKLPEVSKQGREIGVFLAFSRIPSSVKQIEQDLRRRTFYPGELRRRIKLPCYFNSLLPPCQSLIVQRSGAQIVDNR